MASVEDESAVAGWSDRRSRRALSASTLPGLMAIASRKSCSRSTAEVEVREAAAMRASEA